MLLDDLLEHLDGFVALVCKDKTSRQFLARICILRLQFQNAQIQRYRFLQLLGRSIIVGHFLENRWIVSGVFDCSFEYIVDLF